MGGVITFIAQMNFIDVKLKKILNIGIGKELILLMKK